MYRARRSASAVVVSMASIWAIASWGSGLGMRGRGLRRVRAPIYHSPTSGNPPPSGKENDMPPHRLAYRPVVMGTRGAVASAHPHASMAGIRVLLEGGNAVDAAVAVGSTLNVVEPFMSGAGGVGLMMISRGAGERHLLDFNGPAPAATPSGAALAAV